MGRSDSATDMAEERYSAAALFTLAIEARHRSLAASSCPPRVQVQQEAAGRDQNPAVAETPDQCAPIWLGDLVAQPRNEPSSSSTDALLESIYRMLGVPTEKWMGLKRTSDLFEGQTVQEVLAAFLTPLLTADHDRPPADVLAEIVHLLTKASFEWPASSLQEANKRMADAEDKILPTEQTGSQTARWHDARARQAILDLASWLRPQGGPDTHQVEEWLSEAATESLLGKDGLTNEAVQAASKWTSGRMFMVGGTTVAAGTLLAVTGGMAAPAIAAGLASASSTLLGAGAASAVSGVATTTAITAAMGGVGAKAGGMAMARRTSGVEEFGFLPMSKLLLPGIAHVEVTLQVEQEAGQQKPVTVLLRVNELSKGEEKKPSFLGKYRKMFRVGAPSSWFTSKKTKPAADPDAAQEEEPPTGEAMTATEGSGSAITSGDDWKGWQGPVLQPMPWPGTQQVQGRVLPESTICVAGWVKHSPQGYVRPFESAILSQKGCGDLEVHCLLWESKELVQLANAIYSLVTGTASSKVKTYFFSKFISAS
mmetsp:Transcript_20741/g.57577  ORF Transcript_20741/g.57577 Transcript_20741/m.57577 type:complete len:540 (-) Transcript_20741:200-1819(-)